MSNCSEMDKLAYFEPCEKQDARQLIRLSYKGKRKYFTICPRNDQALIVLIT
jgi:hypothetical protein